MKKLTRKQRLDKGLALIWEGFEAINEVKDELQEWRDNLPENLENSPTAEKLDEVLNCQSFDEIENSHNEIEELELPKGFGRD